MATMLRDRTGSLSLSTAAMRSFMDSIGSRLDEARDTGRYLVGLLVFLGLLGTFWGLLETINSVGRAIDTLDTKATDNVQLFGDLKAGLSAPLKGMGTAFSSSLLGLAGSLVLGFLELQASHAHNRISDDLFANISIRNCMNRCIQLPRVRAFSNRGRINPVRSVAGNAELARITQLKTPI